MEKVSRDFTQLKLMEYLKHALPANLSLVEELSDVLELSNDSIYRRIRGETALSVDELAAICKHFSLSFDAFLNSDEDGFVTFSYSRLNSKSDTYESYLINVLNDLRRIANFEEKQIIYAAEDIPLFYHFHHPELAAFKMFYWQKSIMNLPEFENKKFSKEIITDEFISLTDQILKCYLQIPSIEIWSDETICSTLKQIEFYWDSGIISSKGDALSICSHVESMMANIKLQAENSEKMSQGKSLAYTNYSLYLSDIMIGTNCILVDTNGVKSSYLSFNTFNTMTTNNSSFCTEIELWLGNLLKKSNLISGVAEKQRYQFFRRIEMQLEHLKGKIEESV
mgnify:CR=1 FL=1